MAVRHQTQRALRFRDLIPYRVAEVLLVSSPYDAFILEQDGGLTEQIFLQFTALSLTAPPRFTHVPTAEAALERLDRHRFDLVITMTGLLDAGVNAFGRQVKARRPDLPVVLLALERKQLQDLKDDLDSEAIDGAFLWSGDANILLAILKYVEDRSNVDHDIEHGNVRVIIVIEDSPAYYSAFLAILYLELMKQAQALHAEGVNNILRQLYMKSRPKILHATTFEQGQALFERYRANVMAIISDLAFPRESAPKSEIDPLAGLDFARRARLAEPSLPVLLQSADRKYAEEVAEIGGIFVDKSSPNLLARIRAFLSDSLGFGDFIFRNGQGEEIDRARDLRELEAKIASVPVDSIYYHAARDHFSIWLQARSEFRLAEIVRPQKVSDFTGVESARKYLTRALRELHDDELRRVVSDFSWRDFDRDPFSRLGKGSLGGKARGMAFMNTRLAELDDDEPGSLPIEVPKTVVITTDYFDHFVDANQLRDFAYTSDDDQEIRGRFLAAKLSEPLISDLRFILEHLEGPLAVRSSSLLEDSMDQPLAGIYSTLMLANNAPDLEQRLEEAIAAVKLIYASTFLSNAKSFLKSTGNRIEEEKMAVILQKLVGRRHGRWFYPSASGVAQSYNFYPVAPQKAEDGLVHLALGLGRLVVDGGQALRVSPRHPEVMPQFYKTKILLDHSQRGFYALDLESGGDAAALFDNVQYLGLDVAERDGTLQLAGSVYSVDDRRITDDLSLPGPRVVTFNNILKHRAIPLTEVILKLLEIGQEGFGCPVEIEFALDMGDWGQPVRRGRKRTPPTFFLLQIRPFGGRSGGLRSATRDPVRIRFRRQDCLCVSQRCLGNGVGEDLADIVYVRPEHWDAARNKTIAAEVGELNQVLSSKGRRYALIGPGRWGSADHWLGIPVQWSQISNARVIVEASPAGYAVEPSQGAHFFQNMTALEVGYFTLPPGVGADSEDEYFDWDWLDTQGAAHETEHLRHLRLETPLTVVLDGQRGHGVIAKPGAERI